jgi:DNA polymerase
VLVRLFKPEDFDLIDDICYDWEQRTRMDLEFEEFTKVFQKDVNNYIIINAQGKYKSKGGYVKQLTELDYDLPIVNRAVADMMIYGIPPEETVNGCQALKDFQKIVKVSSKYKYALYNPNIELNKVRNDAGRLVTVKDFIGGAVQKEKCFRVFASSRSTDGGIFKVKTEAKNPEKFANTPERCFIINESVNDAPIPAHLDRAWYIAFAKKRLKDFGVMV